MPPVAAQPDRRRPAPPACCAQRGRGPAGQLPGPHGPSPPAPPARRPSLPSAPPPSRAAQPAAGRNPRGGAAAAGCAWPPQSAVAQGLGGRRRGWPQAADGRRGAEGWQRGSKRWLGLRCSNWRAILRAGGWGGGAPASQLVDPTFLTIAGSSKQLRVRSSRRSRRTDPSTLRCPPHPPPHTPTRPSTNTHTHTFSLRDPIDSSLRRPPPFLRAWSSLPAPSPYAAKGWCASSPCRPRSWNRRAMTASRTDSASANGGCRGVREHRRGQVAGPSLLHRGWEGSHGGLYTRCSADAVTVFVTLCLAAAQPSLAREGWAPRSASG